MSLASLGASSSAAASGGLALLCKVNPHPNPNPYPNPSPTPNPSPNPNQVAVAWPEPLFPFLLVNMGSGVSVVRVDSEDHFARVGGTACGGATFLGL